MLRRQALLPPSPHPSFGSLSFRVRVCRICCRTTTLEETGETSEMIASFRNRIEKLESSFTIESAYFVVPERGVEFPREIVDKGVRLRALTNSLASNNVLPAQTGHSKRRKKLVEAGMELYELRPDAASVLDYVAPHAKEVVTTLHTDIQYLYKKKPKYV